MSCFTFHFLSVFTCICVCPSVSDGSSALSIESYLCCCLYSFYWQPVTHSGRFHEQLKFCGTFCVFCLTLFVCYSLFWKFESLFQVQHHPGHPERSQGLQGEFRKRYVYKHALYIYYFTKLSWRSHTDYEVKKVPHVLLFSFQAFNSY